MRIGVDARELSGSPTGVGRVVSGLLDAWPGDDDIVLYGREPLPWRYLGGSRRSRIVPGPPWLPGSAWEQLLLPAVVRRDDVDVLLSPAYGMPLASPCPTVVGMHDCACETLADDFTLRERLRRRWNARVAAHRARFLFAGSRFAAREIERHLDVDPSRIVVLPYGVTRNFLSVPPGRVSDVRRRYDLSGRAVLFLGAWLTRRNLPRLVRVVAELADGRPDLSLHVVGPRRTGESAPTLPTEATRRLGRRLRFLGFVPDDDLPAILRAATVLAYPTVYEGFGLPVLEALACGTPVVASAAGSLPEIFDERAWLVPVGDDGAWHRALATLLDDKEARRRWVRRSRPWARRRTWDGAARRLREILRTAARVPDSSSLSDATPGPDPSGYR